MSGTATAPRVRLTPNQERALRDLLEPGATITPAGMALPYRLHTSSGVRHVNAATWRPLADAGLVEVTRKVRDTINVWEISAAGRAYLAGQP